jgi:hypothetical protein
MLFKHWIRQDFWRAFWTAGISMAPSKAITTTTTTNSTRVNPPTACFDKRFIQGKFVQFRGSRKENRPNHSRCAGGLTERPGMRDLAKSFGAKSCGVFMILPAMILPASQSWVV